jgi:hypothetical protein
MSRVRAARVACSLIVLLAAASTSPADEPGIVKIESDGQGSGVVLYRQTSKDGMEHVILTANHVVRLETATIDGATGRVVARDKDADLAIVLVRLPKDRQMSWYAPKWLNPVGKAKLYGFPAGKYEEQDCTVDEKGELSCQVRAGGSGGPLFKDGYVIGILTRYHGVATSKQIYAFLDKHGYRSVFEPEEPK